MTVTVQVHLNHHPWTKGITISDRLSVGRSNTLLLFFFYDLPGICETNHLWIYVVTVIGQVHLNHHPCTRTKEITISDRLSVEQSNILLFFFYYDMPGIYGVQAF